MLQQHPRGRAIHDAAHSAAGKGDTMFLIRVTHVRPELARGEKYTAETNLCAHQIISSPIGPRQAGLLNGNLKS